MNTYSKLPKLGSLGGFQTRQSKFLLLGLYDPAGISTIPETIRFIQSHSKLNIEFINLYENRAESPEIKLRQNIDLSEYGGFIIHNSLSYDVDSLWSLDKDLSIDFKSYDGVKVLMKQDENHRFREMAQYIGEKKFDLIFTCLPRNEIKKIYPKKIVGNVSFSRMLTGYVTPTLRQMNFLNKSRSIDIGYRGSIQPLSFGRLAYEKRSIGEDSIHFLKESNLKLDISSNWEDRKGGDSWFNFLLNCKSTLGAESGASIFDLKGDLEVRCERIKASIGQFNKSKNYAESFLSKISDLENLIKYEQISPRHFEAIATGTIQLLFPGTYSNILVPGKHYFKLERNFSNINEAVRLVNNEEKRLQMAKSAFKDVILNKENWIETFVEHFDKKIFKLINKKNKKYKPILISKNKHNVLLIAAHPLGVDPRLKWIQNYSVDTIKIHSMGIHQSIKNKFKYLNKDSTLDISVSRQRWTKSKILKLYRLVGSDKSGQTALSELIRIDYILSLNEEAFCSYFGAPYGHERNEVFRWYLGYILDISISLILASVNLQGLSAIISTDLDTLLAASVIKSFHRIPVIYDAHEFWPESDVLRLTYEKQFFINFEKKLIKNTDYRQTVSPGLARIMSDIYSVPVFVVPNCEPKEKQILPKKPLRHNKCIFLYQGNFAPARGIDLLINIWAKTNSNAILHLRGPDSDDKSILIELAKKTGLFEKRIFFPRSVKEEKLVSSSSLADVGIVSYTPTGLNYQNCSPNKLSQYMAAKLPLLCNDTNFIREVIKKSKAGIVIDFNSPGLIVESVNNLTNNKSLRIKFSNNAYKYYINKFNWQYVSKNMYKNIKRIVNQANPQSLLFYNKDLESQLGIWQVANSLKEKSIMAEVNLADLSYIYKTEESNTISEENSTISDESNTISDESNTISEENNTISEENNTISDESNTIAEENLAKQDGHWIISKKTENIDAMILRVSNEIESYFKKFDEKISSLLKKKFKK